MKYITLLALAIILAVPATGHAQIDGAVGADGSVQDDASVFYGEPIPPIEEYFNLTDAVKQAKEMFGIEMIVSGRIVGPCAGDCWMMLQHGKTTAQIVFVDQNVKLPKDVIGKDVEVFGNIEFVTEQSKTAGADGKPQTKEVIQLLARSLRFTK